MLQVNFYGGVREIGGTKILLEDGERKLFLDFGFPYKRYKELYEEYMKPRSGAGLLDPLRMGLLPALEGAYRNDIEPPGLWQRFQGEPSYRRLDHVDGILLSHAHLDHSGHIAFLSNAIPVYSTATTAFIAKAIQDSGTIGFDQQVCYYHVTERSCPADWRQEAFLSGATRQQRQFCLADSDPARLNSEALRFWSSGFWEKTARQRELVSCPLTDHSRCSFNLRCFPVDHSIPGACAWGIETSAGWIIYSGDLRLHGKQGYLTTRFMEEAAQLHPKALIIEGTNAHRGANVSESEVYENGLKAIAPAKALVIADFSPRDVSRLLIFLQIARDTNRKLAILPKDAYLLKTLRLLHPEIPDIAGESNIAIYQDTIASRNPQNWMRHICQEYASKVVLAEDVGKAQQEFILCFSFWDINELPSINPHQGSLYVFSSSEPHDEEQAIDFRRLHNWLHYFRITGFGLPVEVQEDDWQIPDDQRGLHASGHACGTDLLSVVRQINPEILIPVHGVNPEYYEEHLQDSGIKIILPVVNGTLQL